MAKRKQKDQSNHFEKTLKQALEYFQDPYWLGTHSPLAAPYFQYLLAQNINTSNPDERGRALRALLRETVSNLGTEGEIEQYYSRLLGLTFMEPAQLAAYEIAMRLGVSRATYFRDKPKAIHRLALTLNHHLKPALRLESPIAVGKLYGRDEMWQDCASALEKGQSVGLSGSGGIGKTALGIHLVKPLQPVFWCTFRLGINDHPRSFLFELAHFLSQQGMSRLWAQLVTDKTALEMNIALALVRYDLERLPTTPVLCFDDVDLLRPAELEAHANLLAFLESLKGLTPLLFIGQQLPLEVDLAFQLSGLTLTAIESLLKQANIDLMPPEIERLKAYTLGNPRLLELFMGLHRSGEPIGQLLSELATVPSLEFLLRRSWQRLSQPSQEVLAELVPFRRPAPRDAWNEPAKQEALNELIERRLVQDQQQGEIILLSPFRSVLYKWLSSDTRQVVHLRAATIRAARGEYTAAAYHYLQAGETQIAFRLWQAHQEEELNQGQASAALSLFEGMAPDQLGKRDAKRWALLRAELLRINGDYEQSRQSIATTQWEMPALAAQAKRLEGDIAELREELEAATDAYYDGLQSIERLLSEKAQFHKNLGGVVMRQHKLDDAWREAMLADYESQNLKGYIQEQMGHVEEAKGYYLKALKLAQEAGYDYGQAKTYNNLGRLLTWQGEFNKAEEYFEKAHNYSKRRGEISHLASVRVNQALLFLLSRQHQAAIEPAKEAADIFERLGEPWGRDAACLNLAEAYLGAGDLQNAEATAQPLIQRNSPLAYNAWWVLGEVRLGQEKYENATECLQQAIELAEEHKDRILEGYAQRSLGKVYRTTGDNEAAQTAFEKAIDVFTALKMSAEVEQTREEMGGDA